jgi:hypothetical protein
MLHSGVIEARTPYGRAQNVVAAPEFQKVVCFTETPPRVREGSLGHRGRQVNPEPYGLVFTKAIARRKGALPVWYVDADSEQIAALEALQNEAWRDQNKRAWKDHPAAKLFPFVESMGSWPNPDGSRTTKEFSWEREWRHRGSFAFDRATELALIIAPAKWHSFLREHYGERPCVDADWSLEGMLASLADMPS